jgi:drug/metabolite transporter (DMT)-like permease
MNSRLPPAKKLALPALLGGAMLISFSGIFVKLSDTDPVATGFYRLFLPLPLLFVLLMADMRTRPAPGKMAITPRAWIGIHCAAFFLAADLIAWHWSLQFIGAAAATVLGNTAPIWVAVSGYLFFGERFGLRFVAGLSIAMTGVVILIAGGDGALRFDDGLGFGLAILGAIGYAGYLWGVKAARASVRLSPVMFWTAALGAAWLLPVALLTEDVVLPFSLQGLMALLGLAFMSQVAGQGLIAWSLAHLPAGFSSVTLLINPVATAYIAWLILGETLSPLQIGAGAVVMAGIYLARPARAASV